MIAIVRMKAEEKRERLWDNIVTHAGELQGKLGQEGRLLFLSQRAKHGDVSLFVHVVDPDVLGSLIARDLSKIEGLTGCWLINMLKPLFFALPEDTGGMKRYIVTVRVFPPQLADVYEQLARQDLPPGMAMAYLALTCHLYGDCLRFSVLTEDEERLTGHITENVIVLPGVQHAKGNLIERTKPLLSYDEWRDYSTRHSLVPSWNEANMVHQFGA